MYNVIYIILSAIFILSSCGGIDEKPVKNATTETVSETGQENVKDDVSQKDIVKIAASSPDHTTLVAALKQAGYVNDLSNAGPFTVFAPTNAAFDKLPAGTLDDLMKNENAAQLKAILEYHVAVGGYKTEFMQDGQTIGMASGSNITIQKNGDKIMLNNSANIIATVPASNGTIHVIDAVLLPPAR
jgi:uncharacterized surface protein with fasciclin (FAS1) repeats